MPPEIQNPRSDVPIEIEHKTMPSDCVFDYPRDAGMSIASMCNHLPEPLKFHSTDVTGLIMPTISFPVSISHVFPSSP